MKKYKLNKRKYKWKTNRKESLLKDDYKYETADGFFLDNEENKQKIY